MNKSWLFIGASIIFILIFDLWVEHSKQAEEFFNSWIKPIFDGHKVSLAWVILVIVFFIILISRLSNKNAAKVEQLEEKLKSEMEILVQANSELSDFRLRHNISIILEQFVRKNPYVIAVQYYKFLEQRLGDCTNFKVNYLYGSVAESVDLNAIHQLYYKCSSSVVRDFRKSKHLFLNKGEPDSLVDFALDLYNQLEKKPEEDLSQYDAVLCSFLFLALEILERDFDIGIEFLGDSEEKLLNLVDENRTGLLRTALMNQDFYSFTHRKENSKYNRQYISRLVKIREEEGLFMIALDASILEDDDYDEIMYNIAHDFENLLIKMENMYNKSIVKVDDENANQSTTTKTARNN